MANFMSGFMRGYDFVDKHKRLTREEERLEQERERNKVLQGRQDELWQRQQQGFADQDKLKKLSSEDYALGTLMQRIKAGDQAAIQEAQNNPQIQGYMQQFNTPEKLDQMEADIVTMENAFQGKATKADAIGAANRFLKPFLNYGDGGENKRIADIFPSQSGQGLYAELEMEENGKTKRAPLTTNRSASDQEVKEIPMQPLIQAISFAKQQLAAQRIALGDSYPIQERNSERQRELTRQDKREATDYEHKKSLERLAEKYRLDSELLKTRASAGAGGGKAASTRTKLTSEHYKQFNDVLMKDMIRRYGLKKDDFVVVDDMGNQRIDEDRFYSSLPKEGQSAWMSARRFGENFMSDGGYDPVNAAITALNAVYKQSTTTGQGGRSFSDVDAKDPAMVEAAESYLFSIKDEADRGKALMLMGEQNPELIKALDAKAQALRKTTGNGDSNNKPENYVPPLTAPKGARSGGDIKPSNLTRLYRLGKNEPPEISSSDPVAQRVYTLTTMPKAPGMSQQQYEQLVAVIGTFNAWAKANGMQPGQVALEAYAKENPEQAQMVAALIQ